MKLFLLTNVPVDAVDPLNVSRHDVDGGFLGAHLFIEQMISLKRNRATVTDAALISQMTHGRGGKQLEMILGGHFLSHSGRPRKALLLAL